MHRRRAHREPVRAADDDRLSGAVKLRLQAENLRASPRVSSTGDAASCLQPVACGLWPPPPAEPIGAAAGPAASPSRTQRPGIPESEAEKTSRRARRSEP